MNYSRYHFFTFITLGFIFLRSGYEKLESGSFAASLATTLTKFASKNPYPWYKSFLESVAIPNSNIFGALTMYGELLSGISMFGLGVYFFFGKKVTPLALIILGLGLLGGAFLNATFWLASGWTSPSADSLNLLMFLLELNGLIYIFNQLRNWQK